MNKPTTPELKIVYRDVLKGYTKINIPNHGKGFVKHLSIFDSIDLDEYKQKEEQKALKQGVPSEEEQLEYLDKEGLWDSRLNQKIDELESYSRNLEATRKKLFLKSQLDELKDEINSCSEKIETLLARKKELIGITAKSYAEKRVNEYYIRRVMYKDSKFEEFLLTEEQYDDLDDAKLTSLVMHYNESTKLFKTSSFKLIALSSFMSNSFYMCDNNPYFFYGKPVVDLTFFQTEVFSHAAYFKHIMSDSKTQPPDDIKNNPDELIEWFESSKNAEEAMDKIDTEKSGGSSLVGATKEDLERLGLRPPGGKSLSAEAAKRGGTLSMEDFMEIHGQ